MSTAPTFNASICEGVVAGHCVVLDEEASNIVYAGPIKGAPDTGGKLIVLNPVDFAKLKSIVDRGRH